MTQIYIPIDIAATGELPEKDPNKDGYSIEVPVIDHLNNVVYGCFGVHNKYFYPSCNEAGHATHWLKPVSKKEYLKSEIKKFLKWNNNTEDEMIHTSLNEYLKTKLK